MYPCSARAGSGRQEGDTDRRAIGKSKKRTATVIPMIATYHPHPILPWWVGGQGLGFGVRGSRFEVWGLGSGFGV